jgi:uncharacterized protein YndB with AHSA1/START domain
VVLVEDDGPLLRAVVELASCDPGRALAAFTDPAVLARWWGGELTADLQPGGRYSVWFAKVPARLVGRVVGHVPASMLAFTWGWEHESDEPERTVTVTVSGEPSAAGASTSTVLTVEHGPHGEDEAGLSARASHREGWEFFLPRLAAVLAE